MTGWIRWIIHELQPVSSGSVCVPRVCIMFTNEWSHWSTDISMVCNYVVACREECNWGWHCTDNHNKTQTNNRPNKTKQKCVIGRIGLCLLIFYFNLFVVFHVFRHRATTTSWSHVIYILVYTCYICWTSNHSSRRRHTNTLFATMCSPT